MLLRPQPLYKENVMDLKGKTTGVTGVFIQTGVFYTTAIFKVASPGFCSEF